jgi:hypothetical protein
LGGHFESLHRSAIDYGSRRSSFLASKPKEAFDACARIISISLLGRHLLQRSTCLAGQAPSCALPRRKLGYARLSFVVFGNLAATQVLLPKTLWHSRLPANLRMLIVGYCYGIRHERRLCEEVRLHLAYRWLCKLDLDDKVPHHSTFSIGWGRPRNSTKLVGVSTLMMHVILEVLFGWLAANLLLAGLWVWWKVRSTRREPAIRLVRLHKASTTAGGRPSEKKPAKNRRRRGDPVGRRPVWAAIQTGSRSLS